ncbi:uncharacterized protein LOC124131503 [Haliotis rufescens]|uniref:uncharacterized protein LOC124131503 n=1 Tax=Haliotis rufescens TaxID=6454 RepID=UPI00201F9B9D|nr:uncharacterized protein LOC124131503 [Haliotis rufescens]
MEFDTSVLMRQAAPPSVDSSGPLSKRQILFTNWLLLGLDVPTQQRTYSIPFNKDMFNLPNKAGAEAILHFLFDRLNPVMCKEEFRDCWRVSDKKTEAMFYRVCNKWLKNIQKEEPDSRLPRINASLFMSPGGERFYQLLFSFTSYVMQQVIKRDCDVKQRDKLTCPQLSSHNKHLSDVMYRMMQCGVVQRREKFLEQVERTISVSDEWRETASELVRENRRLSKSIRELEHQLREETQRAHEKGLARGSPMPSKRKSFTSEHDHTPHVIRRAQRVQKARDKWKKLEAFCNFETRERQVIESILDRTVQKYHIDAADISVKVPDLLLRECENEILKRHVDNTYQGGRLNLLSLIQLWNLSLHLYIERFHQVGVPSLETESSHLTAAVHTHQAQTANANAFQKMLSEDFLPLLKQSVSRLREKLEADTSYLTDTPQSGRTKSVGLGLFSSTPPLSFTPKDEDPVPPQSALHITPQHDAVMTPEAADCIASTVTKSARNVAKTLFQGSPVYAPKMAMQGRQPFSDRIDTSKIPQPKQIKKDRPTSCRTPSKAREHLYQQSVQTPDTSLRAPHISLLTDPVSDVMSSSTSDRSNTLTESQMGPGTPRSVSGVRDSWNGGLGRNNNTLTESQMGPGTPRSVSGVREMWNGGMENKNETRTESQMGPGTPRSVSGVRNSHYGGVLNKATPNNELFLTTHPRGTNVDEFVDEIVSHMLDLEDLEDTENCPPLNYAQRLQDQTRSVLRSPFSQAHPQAVVRDEVDLNSSNINHKLLEVEAQQDRGFSKGQNVSSRDAVSKSLDREEYLRNSSFERGSEKTIEKLSCSFVGGGLKLPKPSSSVPPQHSPVKQQDPDAFRYPDLPYVFVKNGPPIPTSQHKPHHAVNRSADTEVFRHPDMPEDVSPEIDPHGSQRPRKVVHSPADKSHLSLPIFPNSSSLEDLHQTAQDVSNLSEDLAKSVYLEDKAGVSRQTTEQEAVSGTTVTSPSHGVAESAHQSDIPLSPRQNTIQSPERKLGSHLETEIRRLWRQSLDGETLPGSPHLERPASSPRMTTSLDLNVNRSAKAKKSAREGPPHQSNGFSGMLFQDDEEFTTLDDLTADILLSPEALEEEEEDIPVKSSIVQPKGSSTHIVDDLFHTKTPQIPRFRSKYMSLQESPFSQSTEKVNTSSSLDPPSRFDTDALSPWMSQTMPMFSKGVLNTSRPETSFQVGDADSSQVRSVFDDTENVHEEDATPDRFQSLDESFAPLSEGLQLQGKSPFKSVQDQNRISSEPTHDEIMARFHQFKKSVLQDKNEGQRTLEPELLQSTSSSDERLMSALEQKYITGLNTSWSLLDDETLDDINCLQDI